MSIAKVQKSDAYLKRSKTCLHWYKLEMEVVKTEGIKAAANKPKEFKNFLGVIVTVFVGSCLISLGALYASRSPSTNYNVQQNVTSHMGTENSYGQRGYEVPLNLKQTNGSKTLGKNILDNSKAMGSNKLNGLK